MFLVYDNLLAGPTPAEWVRNILKLPEKKPSIPDLRLLFIVVSMMLESLVILKNHNLKCKFALLVIISATYWEQEILAIKHAY